MLVQCVAGSGDADMNHVIREWIRKDSDRRRIYETDPIYHAQAQILSTVVDALDSSFRASGISDQDREHALQAAVLSVLGSIEAAEQRILDTQTRIRLSEHLPHPSQFKSEGPSF